MRHSVVLLALLLGLGGCAGLLDPYEREGTWRISGINEDNLRAMVQNPLDLQRGTGTTDSDGQQAADAVIRLRTDKVRELPASNLSSVGGTGGSGGAGAGGSGGGS